MTFNELSRDQKIQLKQNYMIRLADDGKFIKTVYGTSDEPERDPSWGELIDADSLIPDEWIERENFNYVEDDFF